MKFFLLSILSINLIFAQNTYANEVSNEIEQLSKLKQAIEEEQFSLSLLKIQLEKAEIDKGIVALELPTEILAGLGFAVGIPVGFVTSFSGAAKNNNFKRYTGNTIFVAAVLGVGVYIAKTTETFVTLYVSSSNIDTLKTTIKARELALEALLEAQK